MTYYPPKPVPDCDRTVRISDAPSPQVELVCPSCHGRLQLLPQSPGEYACTTCGFRYNPLETLECGAILMGKYRLLNNISAGGFGDIYLCHPLNDANTRYVLKVLRDLTCRDEQERFKREAHVMQMLDHPSIVKIIDSWTCSSGAFIVMEYVDGVNLAQAIDKYEINQTAVLQVAHEVVVALKYAWDTAKVVHRDIKPSNIMIGNDMTIKLLDFGMAKSLEEDQESPLTKSNEGLGTPGYMSPEQFTNAKNVDYKSDIYSLGATLCFLLLKRNPVKDMSFVKAHEYVERNSPPSGRAFYGLCNQPLVTLIQSMMQLVPARRPTYEAILAETERLLG